MYLIVGLGNPGKEYEETRHNVGRMVLLAFHKKINANDFSFNKKWNALVAETKLGKEKLVLVLPETFMNKSGNAVGPAARFYKTKPSAVIIVHDDSDIELGRAKLSFNKSSGGHKGVESVKRALKTEAYWRFRIGVQKKKRVPAEKLVLQKFTPNEKRAIAKIIKQTANALETLRENRPEIIMNAYNAQ
ncbi:MAG: aminoacyl-tRNA hydrolase [bacterium]|nr:aminoacyl-tRNA hydrolase [bacterium]